MINAYTIPTHFIDVNLYNITRKISFDCGVAELIINSYKCTINYQLDEELEIYNEELNTNYYDVKLRILNLDNNVICEESVKDIKKFAEYISKEDELIYNCIEEMFYDGELENANDEVLIDKIVNSIKENLSDYCYEKVI